MHVASGDAFAARLREADIPGEIVPWRETMGEGPLPNGLRSEEDWRLRARVLAAERGLDAQAWFEGAVAQLRKVGDAAASEEIVLWFDQELSCLANLAHLLDWLAPVAPAARLSLVLDPDAVPVGGLAELLAEREPLERPRLVLARAFWNAISHPDPSGVPRLLRADLSPWPRLAAALRAHLARFPDARGLDAREATLLELLAHGPVGFPEIFAAWRQTPLARDAGLGEAQVALALRRLPALVDGAGALADARRWRLAARPETARVLAGEVEAPARERWIGGCHLEPGGAAWRRKGDTLVRA